MLSWPRTPELRFAQPKSIEAVLDGMQRLLQDGSDLSDFTFVADGSKEWKVHKAVLFMHSDVLHKMSSNVNSTESKTGRAELKDLNGKPFDAQCVEALVHYLYYQELLLPWAEFSWGLKGACSGWNSEPLDDNAWSDSSSYNHLPGPSEGEGQSQWVANSEWTDKSPVPPDDVDHSSKWQWSDCDHHPKHGIDFLISMASIADMYNMRPLKALAITEVEKFAACDMPDKIKTLVDKICAADVVPEEMRRAVVKASATRLACFHMAEPGGVSERQPEFAMEVLKEVAKREHERTEGAKHRRTFGDICAGAGGVMAGAVSDVPDIRWAPWVPPS